MSAFSSEDLKKLVQLSGAIKRAHFKELSPGEVVAISNALTWMAELGEKIELTMKQAEFHAQEIMRCNMLIAELDAKLKLPVKKAKK